MSVEKIRELLEKDPEHVFVNCEPIARELIQEIDRLNAELEQAKRDRDNKQIALTMARDLYVVHEERIAMFQEQVAALRASEAISEQNAAKLLGLAS